MYHNPTYCTVGLGLKKTNRSIYHIRFITFQGIITFCVKKCDFVKNQVFFLKRIHFTTYKPSTSLYFLQDMIHKVKTFCHNLFALILVDR